MALDLRAIPIGTSPDLRTLLRPARHISSMRMGDSGKVMVRLSAQLRDIRALALLTTEVPTNDKATDENGPQERIPHIPFVKTMEKARGETPNKTGRRHSAPVFKIQSTIIARSSTARVGSLEKLGKETWSTIVASNAPNRRLSCLSLPV